MKRRYSETNLPETKLSPSFSVLYPSKAAKKQLELNAEIKKVVTYLAARRLYRNGLSDIDSGFVGLRSHYYLKYQITIADAALSLPEAMCFDYLSQQMKEIMELCSIPDTSPDILKHIKLLTAPGNEDNSEFTREVKRTILEKSVDEFTDQERERRDDLLLMAETLFAFAKCGTVLPFRAMLAKISPEDQKAILNKYGLLMLHHAIIYKRMDFIREMLKHDVDINEIYNSEQLSEANGMVYPGAHSVLGCVVSTLISVLTPEKLRRKPYDDIARFLTTNERGEPNDYQLQPYTAPDLLAVLAQKEELIRLLQSHGADNNVHAYLSTFEPGTPTAPRKDGLVANKEKFPTIKDYCEKVKKDLATMPDNVRQEIGEIDKRVLLKLDELLDLVIAGPECTARQRCS